MSQQLNYLERKSVVSLLSGFSKCLHFKKTLILVVFRVINCVSGLQYSEACVRISLTVCQSEIFLFDQNSRFLVVS